MGVSQAHAWVALGKFCLVDETTAKKSVPLFVQELGRATNPAVRSPYPIMPSKHSRRLPAPCCMTIPSLQAWARRIAQVVLGLVPWPA